MSYKANCGCVDNKICISVSGYVWQDKLYIRTGTEIAEISVSCARFYTL